MKKNFNLLLVALCSLSMLVSCDTNTSHDNSTNGSSSFDSSYNGEQEQITLRIACQTMYGGNSANENNYPMVLAIRKFEEEHKNIKVEILRAPQVPNADETGTVEQDWVEYLTTLASSNQFPDLFMAPNMPNVLMQGWCYDLTDLTKNDKDFHLLYEDFAKSGQFFEHQFALPFCYEFFGYFVNKTLFENNNMDYPEFGVTVDDLIGQAKSITQLVDGGPSVIGISGGGNMFNYMATQFDNSLGWFAWNERTKTFDLKSDAFRKGLEYSLAFYSGTDYSNDALTDEDRERYFNDPQWINAWWNGNEAIHFDYSSMLTNLINAKNTGEINFDFDFIGIPKGNETVEPSVPVKATYMMIGNQTKHPKEAYELLKALTYDPDYYAYKLKTSRENENVLPWTFAPLTNDEIASKAFFDETFPNFPELKKVIENGNFYFDLWATQPGFEYARWNMEYQEGVKMDDILTQICVTGKQKLGDHVDEICRIMNEYISSCYDKLKDIYDL